MIPPSEMATALVAILASGQLNDDIVRTLGVIAIAVALSVVFGFALGLVIHALPRLRAALDPFFATYYAVPVFIFYPVMIATVRPVAHSHRADGRRHRHRRHDHRYAQRP